MNAGASDTDGKENSDAEDRHDLLEATQVKGQSREEDPDP